MFLKRCIIEKVSNFGVVQLLQSCPQMIIFELTRNPIKKKIQFVEKKKKEILLHDTNW